MVVEEEAAAPLEIFLQEEVPLVASVAAPLVGAVLEEAGKLLFHSLRNQGGQGLLNEVLFKAFTHQVLRHEVPFFIGICFLGFLPLFSASRSRVA